MTILLRLKMYHQRTSLTQRPNNNPSIQQHVKTPALTQRVPPQSPHNFSHQHHYIQNSESKIVFLFLFFGVFCNYLDSNRPYSDLPSLASQQFHDNQNTRLLNQMNGK